MATSRTQVVKFFEDYFSKNLDQPFDEDTKIKAIAGFDSLAMVDLSIAFEDEFDAALNLDTFKAAVYLKDIIDEAVNRID